MEKQMEHPTTANKAPAWVVVVALILGTVSAGLLLWLLNALVAQYSSLSTQGFQWLSFFQALGSVSPAAPLDAHVAALISSHTLFFGLLLLCLLLVFVVLPLLNSVVAGLGGWRCTLVFSAALLLAGLLAPGKALFYACAVFIVFVGLVAQLSIARRAEGFWGSNLNALGALAGLLAALGVFTLLSGYSAIELLFDGFASDIGDMLSQHSKVLPAALNPYGYLSPSTAASLFRNELVNSIFAFSIVLGLLSHLLSRFALRKSNRGATSIAFSNWRIPSPIAAMLCVTYIVGWLLGNMDGFVLTTFFRSLVEILSLYLTIQGIATLVFFSKTFRNLLPVILGIVFSVLLQNLNILLFIGLLEQIMQLRTQMQLSVLAAYLIPRKKQDPQNPSEETENPNSDLSPEGNEDIGDLLDRLRGINPEELAQMQNTAKKDGDVEIEEDQAEQLLDEFFESLSRLTPEELLEMEHASKTPTDSTPTGSAPDSVHSDDQNRPDAGGNDDEPPTQ